MGYKILVINWQDVRNPFGGGAEVHLHEIFKRIVGKGHEVTLLCCAHKDLPSEEIFDGIKIIRRGSRLFFNYIVPFYYFKISRQNKFDVVIDDINKIPFYTPLFVKEPLIGIIHHLFGESIFIESSLPVALYVNLAERIIPKIYKNINIAVVSNSTAQELVEKGFDESQLHLVQNAVDHDAYSFRPNLRSDRPMIGYLGRIKKYKSVNHLIWAFSEVIKTIPDARLLIVGNGDFLQSIKSLVTKLNLEDFVMFTGATDHAQKVEYLNKMWVMGNPSPKEGWGLTVIEANNCGVPVVAADSPGLRDSVVHQKTGLLYPYGDFKKCAELIIQLLNNDHLRNSFSENCLNWAHQFDWEQSALNMLTLIEKVLSRR